MSELTLTVISGACRERYAAVPTLTFRVAIRAASGARVDAVALRCQLRIEPHLRRHSSAEVARLRQFSGDLLQWGDVLEPFLWTHVATMVPAFVGECEVDLAVPCTYDFQVTAAKYLHALDDGDIPLVFLFSGSVFANHDGWLHVAPVGWDRESRFRLPVQVWRELMNRYYPNGGWLRLQRATIDRLARVKAARALATFDEVVAVLLAAYE